MNKFKVGDRVAIYAENRLIGTVNNTVLVRPDVYSVSFHVENGLTGGYFHEKQLRRLVKKKYKIFWVYHSDLLHTDPGMTENTKHLWKKVKVVK